MNDDERCWRYNMNRISITIDYCFHWNELQTTIRAFVQFLLLNVLGHQFYLTDLSDEQIKILGIISNQISCLNIN